MRTIFRALMTVTLAACAANAVASPITITESFMFARAVAGNLPDGLDTDGDIEVSTDLGTRSVYVNQIGNEANGSRSWSQDQDSATLAWEASLATTGVQFDDASFLNNLFFTANVDATYSLSGLFSSAGINGTLGLESFNVRLLDVTDCLPLNPDVRTCIEQTPELVGFLFQDFTASLNGTIDETFPLGVAGDGDIPGVSATQGSLTGNLIAGRVYELNLGMALYGEDGGDGTVASGNVQLDIVAAAVPEPAHFGLLAIGLFLAAVRRRSI